MEVHPSERISSRDVGDILYVYSFSDTPAVFLKKSALTEKNEKEIISAFN